MRRRQARRRAFSLIEVMLVMAMSGILAAITVPKLRFDNARVETAARAIDLAIMAAQRDAVSRQHNVLVV
ncbi:MAG: Tfp pilus assembly protein FimT/FimU, partial [Gemmatimonas sp.]|uniref:pilus assembly FimT family protein n=1 Tax=Gemmatimonas sp. TaxID=1962908 RepID=UPI00391F43EE